MTSIDDLPTIGELNRNMAALRDELRDTRGQLGQLGQLATRVEVIGRDLDAHRARVDELDDTLRWVTRLVIGAVVLALVGLVVQTARLTAPAPSTPVAPVVPAVPTVEPTPVPDPVMPPNL